MRPTASRLLKIRLLSQKEVSPSALRLPPAYQQEVVEQKRQEASTSVATRLADTMSAKTTQPWPANLRIEVAEKKTLFWKVRRRKCYSDNASTLLICFEIVN
jgi:hypothetical protein